MKKPSSSRSRLPVLTTEDVVLESVRYDVTASLQHIADRLLSTPQTKGEDGEPSPVIVRVERGEEQLVLLHITTRGNERLTPREKQVSRLVALGLQNECIAARLGIARATVAAHLRRIFGKLEISSRTELAIRSLAF